MVRQDDRGNRYIVATGLTEREAWLLAGACTARGRKQLYWIEPMQITARPVPASPP